MFKRIVDAAFVLFNLALVSFVGYVIFRIPGLPEVAAIILGAFMSVGFASWAFTYMGRREAKVETAAEKKSPEKKPHFLTAREAIAQQDAA